MWYIVLLIVVSNYISQLRINAVSQKLDEKEKRIMATIDEVKQHVKALGDAIDDLKARVTTDVATLKAKIDELQKQIDNGGVVTSEQLDALDTQVDGLKAGVDAIDAPPAPPSLGQ